MDFTYRVATVKCQFCVGKSHCAQCSAEAAEALRDSGAVQDLTLRLDKGLLQVSGPEEDAVLDALEDAGLLVL